MGIDMALRYKGSRNYLHGSDFVNAADAILESERGTRLAEISFRNFARNQCRFWLDAPPPDAIVAASGIGRGTSGVDVPFWIEEGVVAVIDRYPFDEDAIGAAAQIEDRSIVLSRQLPFTLIEIVIAMTKVLAYAKSPKIDGKWVFGQLKLVRPLPRSYRDIRVLQKSMVANRFSNNVISVDGGLLGDMRFIVGVP